jgi:hypothetical protein
MLEELFFIILRLVQCTSGKLLPHSLKKCQNCDTQRSSIWKSSLMSLMYIVFKQQCSKKFNLELLNIRVQMPNG